MQPKPLGVRPAPEYSELLIKYSNTVVTEGFGITASATKPKTRDESMDRLSFEGKRFRLEYKKLHGRPREGAQNAEGAGAEFYCCLSS